MQRRICESIDSDLICYRGRHIFSQVAVAYAHHRTLLYQRSVQSNTQVETRRIDRSKPPNVHLKLIGRGIRLTASTCGKVSRKRASGRCRTSRDAARAGGRKWDKVLRNLLSIGRRYSSRCPPPEEAAEKGSNPPECPVEVEEDDEVMATAMLHSECRAKLCQRLMAYGPP